MDAVNRTLTVAFDALLTPLELLGSWAAMIAVSAIFGVLALIAFKHISWQKGIKAVKDKIKAHMIAIRIYQDDLAVVGRSIGGVLLRNFQYLGLNFGPFVPLAIPFVFVAAQMVVRYGFEPLPVHAEPAALLAGAGTTIEVRLDRARRREAGAMRLELPEGLMAVSPLVRSPRDGRAFVEVVATRPGVHELAFVLADGTRETKLLAAGDVRVRSLQPERVKSPWLAMLWPAEPTLAAESAFERIHFVYPERDLGWFPDGPLGVLLVFVVASMAAGFALLKPLGVQI